jgi:hypothetical protein
VAAHPERGALPRPAEVKAAFARVAQAGTRLQARQSEGERLSAKAYEKFSDLVLPDGLSRSSRPTVSNGEFLKGLRKTFPAFNSYPMPAQRALVDMAYNLGVAKLGTQVSEPRQLHVGRTRLTSRRRPPKAIGRRVVTHRNDATRSLFEQAARLTASVQQFPRRSGYDEIRRRRRRRSRWSIEGQPPTRQTRDVGGAPACPPKIAARSTKARASVATSPRHSRVSALETRLDDGGDHAGQRRGHARRPSRLPAPASTESSRRTRTVEAMLKIIAQREANPKLKGRRVDFCKDVAMTTPSWNSCQAGSESEKDGEERRPAEEDIRPGLDSRVGPAFDRAKACVRTIRQGRGRSRVPGVPRRLGPESGGDGPGSARATELDGDHQGARDGSG